MRRKETTMICCSANWGAGGYLSVRPNANNNKDSETGSNGGASSRIDSLPKSVGGSSNSGAARCAPPVERAELTLVDATLANKSRAAVFRVVDCSDYTPQPFAGGKLMRNPTAPEGRGGGGWGAAGVNDG